MPPAGSHALTSYVPACVIVQVTTAIFAIVTYLNDECDSLNRFVAGDGVRLSCDSLNRFEGNGQLVQSGLQMLALITREPQFRDRFDVSGAVFRINSAQKKYIDNADFSSNVSMYFSAIISQLAQVR